MPSPGLEERTQALGRTLLDAMNRHRPGLDEQVEDWLLTHELAETSFRTRLLRFLDVLAAFEGTGTADEVQDLFHEYFAGDFPGLPRPLRWLVRLARNEQDLPLKNHRCSRVASPEVRRRPMDAPAQAGRYLSDNQTYTRTDAGVVATGGGEWCLPGYRLLVRGPVRGSRHLVLQWCSLGALAGSPPGVPALRVTSTRC